MKTKNLGKSIIYSISILMLALMGCSLSVPNLGPLLSSTPTPAPLQFILTVDQVPVKVTHGSTVTDLAVGDTQIISLNDKVEVGAGGHSQLVYSDRITVEIMQGAEVVMGDMTAEAGDRVEATLLQNKGHVRVNISDSAKAGVILVTPDSQVTSQEDGSVYSVCYKPGAGGLTCVLVEKGSIEVLDKTTGKSQIYPPTMAGYTFNGQAPQPAVCIHADEYNSWLKKMRDGQTVETLGMMVARWIKEPCSGGSPSPTPTA